MGRLKKEEELRLKILAKTIYFSNKGTLKDKAEIIGIDTKTLVKWVQDEKWDKIKESLETANKEVLSFLTEQLSLLKKTIKERENKLATPSEIDSLSKLSKAIKTLKEDIPLSDIVETGKDFITFISKTDYEKGRDIAILFDTYLQHKLNEKNR